MDGLLVALGIAEFLGRLLTWMSTLGTVAFGVCCYMASKSGKPNVLVNQDITGLLWILAITSIVGGLLHFIGGFPHHWWTLVFVLLGLFIIMDGEEDIPNSPPSVALLTIWNKRVAIRLSEGTKLLLKRFPFRMGVQPIVIESEPFMFPVEKIGTRLAPMKGEENDGKLRAGGTVRGEVAGLIEPDYDDPGRLIHYLNKGGKENALKVLQDLAMTEMRNLGIRFTWEEFYFLGAPISALLLSRLTRRQIQLLPRLADGKVDPRVMTMSAAEYDAINNPIADPVNWVREIDTSDPDYNNRLLDAEIFLLNTQDYSVGDILDLGVQFPRLVVKNIIPEGDLGEEANEAAKEELQHRKEMRDIQAENDLIDLRIAAAKKHGQTLSYEEAARQVRLRRNPGSQEISISGATGQMDRAAAIMKTSN